MVARKLESWAATAAATSVVDPGLGQQNSGYAARQRLPAEEFNYILQQLLGDGTPNSGGAILRYTSLQDFVAARSAGELGIVAENYDPSLDPFRLLGTLDNVNSSTSCRACAADGEYFYFGFNNGEVRCTQRDAALTTVWTQDVGGAEQIRALAADGDALYVAHGTEVEKVGRTTGNVFAGGWPYDHGFTVNSLAANGHRVFLGGVEDGSGDAVKSLNPSDGSVIDTAQVGATAQEALSIALDGRLAVYVGHAHDAGDRTLTALEYDLTAFDEGDSEIVEATNLCRAVAVSEDLLFANFDNTGPRAYTKRRGVGAAGLRQVWSAADTGLTVAGANGLATDGTYLYEVKGSGGTSHALRVYDVKTGSLVRVLLGDATDHLPIAVACDGFQAVLALQEGAGSHEQVRAYSIGQKPAMVIRETSTDGWRAPQPLLAQRLNV